jgi:hypothetical protein
MYHASSTLHRHVEIELMVSEFAADVEIRRMVLLS